MFLFIGSLGAKPVTLNLLGFANTPPDSTPKKQSPPPFYVKPILGLGTGMMSYYGNYNESHVANPQYGRLGYELSLSQKVTPSLQFGFYTLFGQLAANEHTGNVYLNFESQIRLGGFQLEYNFDNFFKNKNRAMSPFVSIGFEAFEFLSKTDLHDAAGNNYYYWNDGTIRNVVQGGPVPAANSVILQRDYTYETDIRAQNANGFGKYPENSFAIPLGVGVLFHLSPRMDIKLGTTYHYTFTDYIDGAPKSTLKGSDKLDKFFMSSFMIRYDLTKDYHGVDPHQYDTVDFKRMIIADEDNDMVPDIQDSCLGTPAGVVVDVKGCPLDGDKDGVPDYLDKQLDTPAGSVVDKNGVAVSDSSMYDTWDRFSDSTLKYAVHVVLPPGGKHYYGAPVSPDYTILLGTYKKGLSNENMNKYLSIPDIRTTNLSDSSTAYSAGKFDDALEADKRKQQLIAQGNPDARVVVLRNGKFVDADIFDKEMAAIAAKEAKENKEGSDTKVKETKSGSGTKSSTYTDNTITSAPGVVFRIQLGAFHHKVSTNTFAEAGKVMELQTEDGLYKYVTGSFTNFDDAAKAKIDMLGKGFSGAFIVAYKDGKRVPLTSVGAIPAPKMNPNDSVSAKTPAVDKKLVTFKVQIGAFKNEPPADIKEKFKTIQDVQQSTTSAGLTRYTAGSFQTLAEAQNYKNELKKKGIDGAFVVAFFKNDLISVQEAQELLKQQ
jgi:hypothetical protein